jgi:hypothetical protein
MSFSYSGEPRALPILQSSLTRQERALLSRENCREDFKINNDQTEEIFEVAIDITSVYDVGLTGGSKAECKLHNAS